MMGFNIKRLIFSIIAVYIFISVFEWLFHGIIMKPQYQATQELWRTEQSMQEDYMIFLMLGQLILASVFCKFYARFYGGSGCPIKGAEFGAWVGLIKTAHHVTMYAVAPYTCKMVIMWSVANIIECAIAGVIVALIYGAKSKEAAATS